MLHYESNLFVYGGNKNNNIYIYNILKNKWNEISTKGDKPHG